MSVEVLVSHLPGTYSVRLIHFFKKEITYRDEALKRFFLNFIPQGLREFSIIEKNCMPVIVRPKFVI